MAIINNMPSGSGGGKFKHEVITDLSQLKTQEQSENVLWYHIDNEYLGFTPKIFYAISKVKTESNNYMRIEYRTYESIGYMRLDDTNKPFRAICNFGFTYNDFPDGVSTSYAVNKKDMSQADLITPLFYIERYSYTLNQFDSVEIWAWAE